VLESTQSNFSYSGKFLWIVLLLAVQFPLVVYCAMVVHPSVEWCCDLYLIRSIVCVLSNSVPLFLKLYRLAKEVGKLVTQLRATATEASSTFSEAMESQLAIKEITAASDELQVRHDGVYTTSIRLFFRLLG